MPRLTVPIVQNPQMSIDKPGLSLVVTTLSSKQFSFNSFVRSRLLYNLSGCFSRTLKRMVLSKLHEHELYSHTAQLGLLAGLVFYQVAHDFKDCLRLNFYRSSDAVVNA